MFMNKAKKAIAKIQGFITELEDGITENVKKVETIEIKIELLDLEQDAINAETAVAQNYLAKLK